MMSTRNWNNSKEFSGHEYSCRLVFYPMELTKGNFGNVIRHLRIRSGKGVDEIATAAGLTPRTMMRAEALKTPVSLQPDTVARIAKAFGMTMEKLLAEWPEMEVPVYPRRLGPGKSESVAIKIPVPRDVKNKLVDLAGDAKLDEFLAGVLAAIAEGPGGLAYDTLVGRHAKPAAKDEARSKPKREPAA